MDIRPGGSVIRQRLLVLCVMWVMVGARGLSVPPETEAVGGWVLPPRVEWGRRVERLGLLNTVSGYLTTWCNRPELAHPDNENRPGVVRQVL